MNIARKINISKNYYSDYHLNTFFATDALKQQIPRGNVDIHLLNAAIFHCTNYERNRLNMPVCRFHEKLKETAMLHSTQMKQYNFFSHENSYNNEYKALTNRLESVQTNTFKGFGSYGENIADYQAIKANEKYIVKHIMGSERYFAADGIHEILPYSYFEFAKVVVEGWMHSLGHRKNILNPEFKHLGCGCAEYERKGENISIGYFKLTQNFGGELHCDSPIKVRRFDIDDFQF
jgi:uncharacterized protein YkwD